MGGPVVQRRRKRLPDQLVASGDTEDEAMDDALQKCAESLRHGKIAAIHATGCRGQSGCGCRVTLVGPAERIWSQ